MLISDALALAAALTGQALPASAVRWLSELDGRLAFELYRAEAWTPYDPTDDTGAELLVPFPWDGLYVHHLAAQTYFANGEYDRYENERTMCERTLADFRAFLQRTQPKRCGGGFPTDKAGGTGVTVIPARTGSRWFWLDAYALAVKHGFSGTEAEWLASLVGPPGPAGASGTVTDETATDLTGVLCGDGSHVAVMPVDDAPDSAHTGNLISSAAVAGGLAGKQSAIRQGTVALSASWSGAGPYTQSVTVTGAAVTAHSRIDLQPTAAQLAALIADGVQALTVENDNGALTAWALGAAASAAMTVACSVTEVAA